MRRWSHRLCCYWSAAVLVVALAASATASTQVRAYVRIGPPAPIVEVRPAAPHAGRVWVSGYHRWDGRVYVWVPGRWVAPPRAHVRWVPGRWVHDQHHGWYWVEGRWR